LENLYWIVGDFCCFFIFPWFIIKISFKEKLSQYGIKSIQVYNGLKYLLPALLLILIVSWFTTSIESISFTHPVLFEAKNNWSWFIVFELMLFGYIFAWEFLWRGYMLFGLESIFGWYAVFIQTIPFVILHNGKPAIETFSAIAGGIMLGIIAIKTRTILYGVILHFGLIFFIDLFSVIRFRANEFGVGIESLLNIIGK
jgi:membrane protease YdiL (CAAX protease family)